MFYTEPNYNPDTYWQTYVAPTITSDTITSNTKKPVNWMMVLSVAGVAFAALSYFNGRK